MENHTCIGKVSNLPFNSTHHIRLMSQIVKLDLVLFIVKSYLRVLKFEQRSKPIGNNREKLSIRLHLFIRVVGRGIWSHMKPLANHIHTGFSTKSTYFWYSHRNIAPVDKLLIILYNEMISCKKKIHSVK